MNKNRYFFIQKLFAKLNKIGATFFANMVRWQSSRAFWLGVSFASILCMFAVWILCIFEHYAYAMSCEAFKYIRLAFLFIFLGSIILAAAPDKFWAKIVAYPLGGFGTLYGIQCSFKLLFVYKLSEINGYIENTGFSHDSGYCFYNLFSLGKRCLFGNNTLLASADHQDWFLDTAQIVPHYAFVNMMHIYIFVFALFFLFFCGVSIIWALKAQK